MRVVVTGAAGFIGSHLAEALAARGHEVAGVDDYSGGENAPAGVAMLGGRPAALLGEGYDLADPREGDLCECLRLDLGFERPEVLVHCAANAREGASFYSPEVITRTNLWAYARTLRSSIAAGALRRVVVFSSMAVYGDQPAPFPEAAEPKPSDPYGVNKAAMEAVTRQLAPVHGYSYAIVRPHNVFGPRQRMTDRFRNVVGIFCNKILRGEPLRIYGDGSQQRAFSYIDDSLPCYVKLAEATSAPKANVPEPEPDLRNVTVNIGGTVPITIGVLSRAVLDEFHLQGFPVQAGYPVEYVPARVGEVHDAWSTWDRSRDLLGFEEKIGWREGVKRMVAWAISRGPQEWNTDEGVELPHGLGLPAGWAAQAPEGETSR